MKSWWRIIMAAVALAVCALPAANVEAIKYGWKNGAWFVINPGYNNPGYNHPGYNHPGYNNPGYNHPGYGNDNWDNDNYGGNQGVAQLPKVSSDPLTMRLMIMKALLQGTFVGIQWSNGQTHEWVDPSKYALFNEGDEEMKVVINGQEFKVSPKSMVKVWFMK